MAVAHKGGISFGLVYIPCALYKATQHENISFNQLHKECGSRIRLKKVCPNCKEEVKPDQIMRGYEYNSDQYITFTDEEIEKLKTEKDKKINILNFTDLHQIDPMYFEKTYHVLPESGGEKAFELLRTAMWQEKKVAIAKSVFVQKETLLALRATEKGILCETLFYEQEIRNPPKDYPKSEVNEQELTIAKTLINSMQKPFDISGYRDEFQERLKYVIQKKIDGISFVLDLSKDEKENSVASLMDALTKSVEKADEQREREVLESGNK